MADLDGDRVDPDWMLYAFCAAVLLAPLAGWNGMRAVAFLLIAMAIAWVQMAFNPGTGGSAHHAILLWPWPQAVIAISLAGVSRRMGRFGHSGGHRDSGAGMRVVSTGNQRILYEDSAQRRRANLECGGLSTG